ncbi:PREDICTED: tubulin polyglutamylase TTLL6-like [Amphimedon queenslandica]|uniref:Uncharacterized protein n=1 Tax=Amphimedon queenslandica TaxID=400682 RepID=A0A1X7VLS9_AMPQE|nr:PREDICTED: tubulin polyglutamylase TTLL6-like [Amphimedon queenslandica]|eukprot:XP_019864292.1 PREDICTED: tubulin polyglutamylase TTLL6-like [Amphimedon queenslandica]
MAFIQCHPPRSRILYIVIAVGLFLNAILLLRLSSSTRDTVELDEEVKEAEKTSVPPNNNNNNNNNCKDTRRVVWINAKKEVAMSHVMAVFDRLDYRAIYKAEYHFNLPTEPWDVMWSHGYPYNVFKDELKHLLPHQKINHFPGTSCFVSKPKLSTQGFPFMPRSFRLPFEAKKLMAEVNSRPNTLWVQKSNKHRGIRVIKPKEINLNFEGSIVQEFITNPMIIDGRSFDIGVYVVITSINPLRVYVYGEEILWRFCAKNYYPFNPKNKRSYVVDDEYTPAWEIPSLTPLVKDKGLSHKEAFNYILTKKGFKSRQFWDQAHSIIQKVLMHCESNVVNYTRSYASTRNFFELVRFDFILTEELKVWLMEVNLSPNLSSSHTTDNRFLYEQIIFNSVKLTGLARGVGLGLHYNGETESIMLVNDHDIQAPLQQCLNNSCSQNCGYHLSCQLCHSCMSEELSFTLKSAFLEFTNRRNFYRLVPPPLTGCHGNLLLTGGVNSHVSLRVNNYLMDEWYRGKCCQNHHWCS